MIFISVTSKAGEITRNKHHYEMQLCNIVCALLIDEKYWRTAETLSSSHWQSREGEGKPRRIDRI